MLCTVARSLNPEHPVMFLQEFVKYPKYPYVFFKVYEMPKDFDSEHISLVMEMYSKGVVESDCGSIKLFVDNKTKAHYKKL